MSLDIRIGDETHSAYSVDGRAFEIVRRSWLYRGLSLKEFMGVARLMQGLGYIWVDDKFSEIPVLKRRRSSWLYYYQNLSTIPDTKNYKIIDIVGTSNKSFADAAKNAVIEASKTVRKIRRAEITKLDIKVENDKPTQYRAEVNISFEIER